MRTDAVNHARMVPQLNEPPPCLQHDDGSDRPLGISKEHGYA